MVDPDHLHRGHGSRLLQAAIDTLRADGFERAVSWLFSSDDAIRSLYQEAGWAADGAHRELATDDSGARVRQVRLHTAI